MVMSMSSWVVLLAYFSGCVIWGVIALLCWLSDRDRRSALRVLGTPLWWAWLLWWGGWVLGALASDVVGGGDSEEDEPSWRVLRCTGRKGCRGQPVAFRPSTGDVQCAEHLCGDARRVVENEV
jgi:hypothetical protein